MPPVPRDARDEAEPATVIADMSAPTPRDEPEAATVVAMPPIPMRRKRRTGDGDRGRDADAADPEPRADPSEQATVIAGLPPAAAGRTARDDHADHAARPARDRRRGRAAARGRHRQRHGRPVRRARGAEDPGRRRPQPHLRGEALPRPRRHGRGVRGLQRQHRRAGRDQGDAAGDGGRREGRRDVPQGGADAHQAPARGARLLSGAGAGAAARRALHRHRVHRGRRSSARRSAACRAAPRSCAACCAGSPRASARRTSSAPIHRDMSPDNVLLPGGDVHQAKIIDFGIAKDLDSTSATIVGDGFAGKLNYVAPEQLGDFGREVGPWTDVYSLALVILAVANGKNVNMSRLAGRRDRQAPQGAGPDAGAGRAARRAGGDAAARSQGPAALDGRGHRDGRRRRGLHPADHAADVDAGPQPDVLPGRSRRDAAPAAAARQRACWSAACSPRRSRSAAAPGI